MPIPPQLLTALLGSGGGEGQQSSKAMGFGQLAGGLVGGILGLIQRGKANKILKNNPYPTYELPSDINENKQIATNLAAKGLPSEQYAKAIRDIQRQQVTAIQGAQSRRGGLGLVGSTQQASNDALLNLNSADAAQRIANQKTLLGVNSQIAGYKDKQWDWNKRNKYQQDYDYGMSLKGAGTQNFLGGVDKSIAGLMALLGKGKSSYGSENQFTI